MFILPHKLSTYRDLLFHPFLGCIFKAYLWLMVINDTNSSFWALKSTVDSETLAFISSHQHKFQKVISLWPITHHAQSHTFLGFRIYFFMFWVFHIMLQPRLVNWKLPKTPQNYERLVTHYFFALGSFFIAYPKTLKLIQKICSV